MNVVCRVSKGLRAFQVIELVDRGVDFAVVARLEVHWARVRRRQLLPLRDLERHCRERRRGVVRADVRMELLLALTRRGKTTIL